MTDTSQAPSVVRAIVSAHPDGAALLRQLEGAVFSPGDTHVDITPPAGVPTVDLPDGPLAGRCIVTIDASEVGEILVWLEAGVIASAEYAWWSDEPPVAWPSPDQVSVDGD